jgi:hypothetical protein
VAQECLTRLDVWFAEMLACSIATLQFRVPCRPCLCDCLFSRPRQELQEYWITRIATQAPTQVFAGLLVLLAGQQFDRKRTSRLDVLRGFPDGPFNAPQRLGVITDELKDIVRPLPQAGGRLARLRLGSF